MSIFIFLPAFLVFLYTLYRLVKEDYVFIRRNVSSEQMFDIAFNVTLISLLFSRLFYFILHPLSGDNFFLSFFSLNANAFSLSGLVLGAIGSLYAIGKYKKLPLQRLYDFFSVAFAVSVPVGFLSIMFFFQEYILLLYFFNTLFFAFFAYYFIKYFYPKLPVFLFVFSFISLTNGIIIEWLQKKSFITIENIVFALVSIASIVLFFLMRKAKVTILRKAQ